ncbi:MAG: hypothetical protein BRC37_03845 [Cyanobacteria bacterium QH_3_48_40]|nr:MAG: hypothetical protein BRC35_07955 [Cyanobacteria bacterium QH_10_48_56]PSO76225.1 MAG: hypothetical protein BRC37_03845 [Cyanobacteria bacterium QH_3_48_40]PSO81143.1 MAG: hypothetical protein BRC45_12050 [Cyanobacteria bacterium QS_5_48_63]
MLGVVHHGVAIPLVWTRLDKRGNSHTLERMQLFSRFLEHFAHVKVSYLTADRELVGQDWFSYLDCPQHTVSPSNSRESPTF